MPINDETLGKISFEFFENYGKAYVEVKKSNAKQTPNSSQQATQPAALD